jgi:acyl-CoA synthetase (AMP-forming)/AMP-acid ligase II
VDHAQIKVAVERARRTREEQGRSIAHAFETLGAATYTQFLRQRNSGADDRMAVVHGARRLTYGMLFERVRQARGALVSRGVTVGDRVALLLNNTDAYVVWYLAILDYGAIAVPLNTKLVAREIDYIVAHAGCLLIVSEAEFEQTLSALAPAKSSPGTLMIDSAEPVALPPPPHQPSSIEEPAALYYTSGTTGVPKGVMHTHRSQIAASLQCPLAWEYDLEKLTALCVTPLFHIAAHTIFLPVLALGGTLVVEPYKTEATLRLLAEHAVTSFFAVPSMLIMLVEKARESKARFPALRALQFGAAPMPVHKLQEVQALFPNARLVHGMGQTESSGSLVTLPSELAMAKAGSVGLAMPAVSIDIFDDQDRALPPGAVGELVARGPNVMTGYFDAPDATTFTLRHGWLHTGDLGYRDEDGCVFLVDRSKDMIIRGGENIYSTEVEHALASHPDIALAAVIGLPDALFGERVHAVVTVRPSAGSLDHGKLLDHCRTMLAAYKLPSSIEVVDDMPTTATGKIQKAKLREARL